MTISSGSRRVIERPSYDEQWARRFGGMPCCPWFCRIAKFQDQAKLVHQT